MIKLKCACCGVEKEFPDQRAAFEVGWDVPEFLPSWPVSCDLCPGVCAMGWCSHAKAHAYWEKHGRPAKFGPTCFADEDFPKMPGPEPSAN